MSVVISQTAEVMATMHGTCLIKTKNLSYFCMYVQGKEQCAIRLGIYLVSGIQVSWGYSVSMDWGRQELFSKLRLEP